jgi:hypothetical protein
MTDSAAIYRRYLRTDPLGPLRRSYRVHWPHGNPETLLADVLEAEENPPKILKKSHINTVIRAKIDGRDLVIKRFRDPRLKQRLKYLFRNSRSRRAWAAASTLRDAGIDTPAPLGFIECSGSLLPGCCYALTEYVSDAIPARRWIKAWLHQRPEDFRVRFRADLLACLKGLYDRGIYHADTKAGNLLLTDPEDPARRRFWWIDLDCVSFGVSPSRRQVMRNLVQLNGSIGSKLPDEDRLAFVHELGEFFPYLREPGVADHLRAWTLERLSREQRGLCGP